MRTKLFFYLAGCFLIAFILSSCAELVQEFGDMSKLRNEILKLYPDEDVHINLSNGFFLDVSLINSPLKKLSKKEKQAIAQKIGKMVDSIFDKNKITEGRLTFVIYQNYWIYEYTEAIDIYDLKLPEKNE